MTDRDEDLQREIRQHLELEAAEREADGLPRDAAERAARLAFGNVTRVREDARAVWIVRWWEQLQQDLRYAGRLARRNPAFTAGAVIILALGVAASSTIFGAIDAVVLAPLPYDRPAELVHLAQTNPVRGIAFFPASLPVYREWRQRSHSFSALAASKTGSVVVQGLGAPRQMTAAYVSANFFPTLGLRPVLGRGFAQEDDVVGGGHAVLLSADLWAAAFGSDPAVLGRTLTIDGRAQTVVGVVPPAALLSEDAQVFLPLVPFTEDRLGLSELDVTGRLRSDVTIDEASVEMARLEAQLAVEHADALTDWSVRIEPLKDAVVGGRTPEMLYLLLAAAGALLLVACANLSGLLLVRASARTREIAIRTAIGGGRGRIVGQLLTESLLLAAVGGACGVALAYAGTYVLRTTAMADIPRADRIEVNVWVLLFACVVSVVAGVLAGLAPVRQALRLDVQRGIKEGAPSVTRGAGWSRNVLIVGQLAMSIVLLAGAGLTLRTLARLNTMDLGFAPGRILTMQVAAGRHPEIFFAALVERLRALPPVARIAAVSGAPMTPGNLSLNLFPVGPASIPPTESVQADWRVVTTDYFATLGTPLLAGRDFTPHDDGHAPKVIIVNQTLARRMWGDANPIGKQADLGGGGGEPATVIGLVRDVRNHNPAIPPAPTYYVSAYRGVWGPMTLVIRTNADADQLVPLVRSEVAALDPSLPVFDVATLDSFVRSQLAPQRLIASLLGGFSLLAVALAALGIYGVMAYAAGQRTREIALRLALGARRRDVIRPLIRDGLAMTATGIALGLAAAVPLTRLMRSVLTDVSPYDPLSFASAVGLLSVAALMACYVPARRMLRVDPVKALRGD
jgi:putative ABC transport system permease protein